MPEIVQITKVSRRKRHGLLDEITIECPACSRQFVCEQSTLDRSKNRYPIVNAHLCEQRGEIIFFLNVSVPGQEYAVYGVQDYNKSESAEIKKEQK